MKATSGTVRRTLLAATAATIVAAGAAAVPATADTPAPASGPAVESDFAVELAQRKAAWAQAQGRLLT